MPDPSYFQKVQAGLPEPTAEGGASGYFSPPAETLDPNLFDGDVLRGEVRDHIMAGLLQGLRKEFKVDPAWLRIWIAGSGVTYQWAAARGNGDLDVLFSIGVVPFLRANSSWAGFGEDDLAAGINAYLKSTLWPADATTRFGGQTYEVTYFWNTGTGTDIRNIGPYAAYSVTGNRWVVRPPQLSADPRAAFPHAWRVRAAQDSDAAERLTAAYKAHLRTLSGTEPASAAYHNAGASLNLVVAKAGVLFDEIHTGRRAAFSAQGHGYGDWANYRWQSAKESGAVQALHDITAVGSEARAAEETQLYGRTVDPADVVLRRALGHLRNGA